MGGGGGGGGGLGDSPVRLTRVKPPNTVNFCKGYDYRGKVNLSKGY